MQFVVPTVGEISLAHRLVCTQFEALLDVCRIAQEDAPPPVQPILESLFLFYDPVFPDHVAAVFQNAAQHQTRVCDVWAGSCHASVKNLADRVKHILRPDHEELRIESRKATPDETAEDTPAYRQRTYFEACIPPESIDGIRARWADLLSKLKPIGVPDREAIEFSLNQEFAQAIRDAESNELTRAVRSRRPHPAQEAPPAIPAAESAEEAGSPGAVEMLFGWQEILRTVKRPNERAERERIKRLNAECDGPIRIPMGPGGQPEVAKSELIAWWNRKSENHQDSVEEAARQDAEVAANLQAEHNYGRAGTVLPEISGSKKVRKVTKPDD